MIDEFYGINKDIVSLYAIEQNSNGNYLITQGFEDDPIAIYNLEI